MLTLFCFAQIPVKTFQAAANAVVSGPMPEKGHDGHDHGHYHHHAGHEDRPFSFANAQPLKVRMLEPHPRHFNDFPVHTDVYVSFQSAKQPRFLDAGNTLGSPADIDTSESNSNHVVFGGSGHGVGHSGGHHGDHNHVDNAHHHGSNHHHAAISKRIDGQ